MKQVPDPTSCPGAPACVCGEHLFPTDVRALDLAERQALGRQLDHAQRTWLPRLRALVEPPLPEDDFPAFLLATPPFADLQARILGARHRADLTAAVADQLQRFVDAFRDYLRSDADPDVFPRIVRRAG